VTSPTTTLPESAIGTITVTYAADTQTVNVGYVDDDAEQTVVAPVSGTTTVLTGLSGTAVGFTEADAWAGVPEGYEYVSVENVTTFDYDTPRDQTITVHLAHRVSTTQMTTTRTITFTGGGQDTPEDVTQPITWTVTTDEVTGEVTYSTDALGYPTLVPPDVPGFHPSVAEIPTLPVPSVTTTRPESVTVAVSVTYAADTQKVVVIYVDDDGVMPPVDGGVAAQGPSGSAVSFTEADAIASMPVGYDYVSMDAVDSFDFDSGADQIITVHLVHHHTSGSLTTTRTITYDGAGSLTPPSAVQSITWVTDTDEVTSMVTYTTTVPGYPALVPPGVPGFHTTADEIPALPVPSSTTIRPESVTVTVLGIYAADIQTVNIVYIDDEAEHAVVTPKTGAQTVVTGDSGTSVGFTQATAQAGIPTGYDYISMENVTTFDFDSTADQTITVHLSHHISTTTMTTTRTIVLEGAGDRSPADVTQSIIWTVVTDDVTGEATYTTDALGYPSLAPPVVPGFHTTVDEVPALPVPSSTTTRPEPVTVTIPGTYAADTQTVTVAYVDDDENQASVTPVAGTQTVVTGASGAPIGFTESTAQAGIPTGYDYVSIENVTLFDYDSTTNQTITVHLSHHHTMGSLITTRTITYAGAGDDTPVTVVQSILWTTDTDEVTGVTIYTSTVTEYPYVVSPTVPGFHPNIPETPAMPVPSSTTILPVSTMASDTVTYTADNQTVTVVYVDDDGNQITVPPVPGTQTVLTGPSGAVIGFTQETAQSGIPTGYDFVSLENIALFDHDSATDQTITVHLSHRHTPGTYTMTRTITFTGAGADSPTSVTQSILWTTDTDEVTGVVTYTSTMTEFPAFAVPTVGGYSAIPSMIPAMPVDGSTMVQPESTTVTIKYAPTVPPPPAAPVVKTGGTARPALAPVAVLALLLGAGVLVYTSRKVFRTRLNIKTHV